jgi:hypothetical protein
LNSARRSTSIAVWLAVATAIALLWVRSRGWTDTLVIFAPSSCVQTVSSTAGTVHLVFTNAHAGSEWAWSFDVNSSHRRTPSFLQTNGGATVEGPAAVFGFEGGSRFYAGFKFAHLPAGTDSIEGIPIFHATLITIPHWVLIIFALTPAAVQTRQLLLQRSRARRGCCLNCGYDLRGTPDRCPECGTPARNHKIDAPTAAT